MREGGGRAGGRRERGREGDCQGVSEEGRRGGKGGEWEVCERGRER